LRSGCPTDLEVVNSLWISSSDDDDSDAGREHTVTAALHVRTVGPTDIDALAPLVRSYWDFEHIRGFDEARVTAALRRQLENAHMAAGWIAMAADKPVGYLLAVYVFSLEHLGLTAEIDEFYVVPEQRGSGVGAVLLQAAEAAFVAAGCTSVSLQVGRGNDEARAFYERRGYTPRDGYHLLDKALPAWKE
jgi:GNAT superfamily N-acetyltransferase